MAHLVALAGVVPPWLAALLLLLAHTATAGYWYNQPQLNRMSDSLRTAAGAALVALAIANDHRFTGTARVVVEFIAFVLVVLLLGQFAMEISIFANYRKFPAPFTMAITNFALALTTTAYLLGCLVDKTWMDDVYSVCVVFAALSLVVYAIAISASVRRTRRTLSTSAATASSRSTSGSRRPTPAERSALPVCRFYGGPIPSLVTAWGHHPTQVLKRHV